MIGGICERAVEHFDKRCVMFSTTYAGVLSTEEKMKYYTRKERSSFRSQRLLVFTTSTI